MKCRQPTTSPAAKSQNTAKFDHVSTKGTPCTPRHQWEKQPNPCQFGSPPTRTCPQCNSIHSSCTVLRLSVVQPGGVSLGEGSGWARGRWWWLWWLARLWASLGLLLVLSLFKHDWLELPHDIECSAAQGCCAVPADE